MLRYAPWDLNLRNLGVSVDQVIYGLLYNVNCYFETKVFYYKARFQLNKLITKKFHERANVMLFLYTIFSGRL